MEESAGSCQVPRCHLQPGVHFLSLWTDLRLMQRFPRDINEITDLQEATRGQSITCIQSAMYITHTQIHSGSVKFYLTFQAVRKTHSVFLAFFFKHLLSFDLIGRVPSFLTSSTNAKLTRAAVTAVSAQYALEELRLGRAGVSTQENVDVSSHLVLPTWRQRGSHTSNHLEKQNHPGGGGSERPTWVLGFSSKQSQRQSSFDVLVPVDRWRYAGKELQENT